MHVYSGCIRLWIHSGRDIHPLSGNMSTCLQVPRLINEMYITPLVYLWFTSTNHHVSVANLNFHSDTGVVKSKGVTCTCIMCWGYLRYAHNNNVIIWLAAASRTQQECSLCTYNKWMTHRPLSSAPTTITGLCVAILPDDTVLWSMCDQTCTFTATVHIQYSKYLLYFLDSKFQVAKLHQPVPLIYEASTLHNIPCMPLQNWIPPDLWEVGTIGMNGRHHSCIGRWDKEWNRCSVAFSRLQVCMLSSRAQDEVYTDTRAPGTHLRTGMRDKERNRYSNNINVAFSRPQVGVLPSRAH